VSLIMNDPAAQGGVIKPRIVTITTTGVDPPVMKILVGQDVTFVNNDVLTHSISPFSSVLIPPGSSFIQVFPAAGEFGYSVGTFAGTVSVGANS